MIFVDTSVWIQYFRVKDSKIVENLHQLLESDRVALSVMVWLELLSGATQNELPRLKRVLSALPRYLPSEETWIRIERWVEAGLKKGQRFSATDLLIGSIVVDQNAKLWSLDLDYKRMEKLGFLELY